MRTRAVAILVEGNAVVLIERHRAGQHYFTFPGGGVNPGETPEQAVVRATEEETGLRVVVKKKVAEVWFKGNPQEYFLVEAVGGMFGAGTGEEMTDPRPDDPQVGTYHPLWMTVSEILSQPVLPRETAKMVVQAQISGWPEQPVVIYE